MTHRLTTRTGGSAVRQALIDRCRLPLVVGIVAAVTLPIGDGDSTHIALTGGERIAVALHEIEPGELLCLRLRDGVAVTVDFVDGRPPLVSSQLPRRMLRLV
jgi:hypothetical protein